MPVRNAGPFLSECLGSIRNQSITDWELIAVNDHSTDNSNQILKAHSKVDHRIKFIQNEGVGIISALKIGYQFSSGRFITRMDADDRMPSHKLEILYSILCRHGQGSLSTGKVKYISENALGDGYRKYEQWLNGLCDTNNHYMDIYKECVIPSPCWMMFRSDFEAIGGFDSDRYPEDYDLCFRMYAHKIKVEASHEILHVWRDHGGRASRNDENYADNRFLDLKLNYFLELDYTSSERLVLWGAGKKGKYLARILIQRNISFDWVTNNAKKVGLYIYDKKIKPTSTVAQSNVKTKIILAVANAAEQKEIVDSIEKSEGFLTIFKFC
ncbi:MAG: glycosyltransferase family 2 protein [Bacteroidota bacterium]